ncbi:MAG: NeuD/PglB/VioB family sugar acetyltransferase [Acidimicrobiales bacterium]
MSDRLVIVGAGGHGREAVAIARHVNRVRDRWHVIGVVDDGEIDLGLIDGELVLGTTHVLIDSGDEHVIAVGDPAVRRTIATRIGDAAPAIPLVDPSAWIGDDVDLDDGVMVHPGAICTTNVRVGFHSHLNCGVVVSHDCWIGDFVSLSPGVKLNGAVRVGDGAFLGTGAIVLPGRTIGQNAVVGAGAVVVDDVAAGSTVMGVPAR